MLGELFGIPENSGRATVRIFSFCEAGSTTTTWQVYELPRMHSMVFMLAIGAGGGGGAGFSGAASSARGGGGSGGCGGVTRLLIPRIFLPDLLYVQVGAPGVSGVIGGITRVNVSPSASNQTLMIIHANGASWGTDGSASAAGSGGAGGVGVPTADSPFFGGGLMSSAGGINGVTGGAQTGAAGTTVTWGSGGTGQQFSQGAGGGGTTSADFAGGDVTGVGVMPTIKGGAAGSNNGDNGVSIFNPWTFCGGAGGGASNTGIGGNGGQGGIGCGGGGGGGGTTGGTGGQGGPGLAVIVSW